MRFILGLRDKAALFWSGHDFILKLFIKLLLMLVVSFGCLNMSGIGIEIRYILPVLAISLAAAFLPGSSALIPFCVWTGISAWLCSLESALAAGILLMLFLLLYYSFFSRDAWIVIAVVFLCQMRLPSAAALAGALVLGLDAVPGIVGGCFLASLAAAMGYPGLNLAVIEPVRAFGSDSPERILALMAGALSYDAWLLTAMVLAAAFLVVYLLRIIPSSYMAAAAVLAGLIALVMLYGVRGLVYPEGWDFLLMIKDLAFGLVCSAFVLIFRFTLDYKRTEYLRFEDDNYIYYVKAVPKMRRADLDKMAMAKSRAVQDGMAKSRDVHDGMAKSRDVHDGMAKSRDVHDGMAKNRAVQNGMAKNRAVQSGMAKSRDVQNGMARPGGSSGWNDRAEADRVLRQKGGSRYE